MRGLELAYLSNIQFIIQLNSSYIILEGCILCNDLAQPLSSRVIDFIRYRIVCSTSLPHRCSMVDRAYSF